MRSVERAGRRLRRGKLMFPIIVADKFEGVRHAEVSAKPHRADLYAVFGVEIPPAGGTGQRCRHGLCVAAATPLVATGASDRCKRVRDVLRR